MRRIFLIIGLKKCQYDTALWVVNKNKVFTALQRKGRGHQNHFPAFSPCFLFFFLASFSSGCYRVVQHKQNRAAVGITWCQTNRRPPRETIKDQPWSYPKDWPLWDLRENKTPIPSMKTPLCCVFFSPLKNGLHTVIRKTPTSMVASHHTHHHRTRYFYTVYYRPTSPTLTKKYNPMTPLQPYDSS